MDDDVSAMQAPYSQMPDLTDVDFSTMLSLHLTSSFIAGKVDGPYHTNLVTGRWRNSNVAGCRKSLNLLYLRAPRRTENLTLPHRIGPITPLGENQSEKLFMEFETWPARGAIFQNHQNS